MLNRKENTTTIQRENIKGGHGVINQRILIKPEQMEGYARFCVEMTVNPGCSIGIHDHINEAEFFYLIEGELVTHADGKDEVIHPGDATFTTGAGNQHRIENCSDKPAKLLAIVMTPKQV